MELGFVPRPFAEGLRQGPRQGLLWYFHFAIARPLALFYEACEMLHVQCCFQSGMVPNGIIIIAKLWWAMLQKEYAGN